MIWPALLRPLLTDEPAARDFIRPDRDHDTGTAVMADVDDDVLAITLGPVEKPRSGRQLAFEHGASPRWRLMTGRPTREPDPALAGWRKVTGRDAEVCGVSGPMGPVGDGRSRTIGGDESRAAQQKQREHGSCEHHDSHGILPNLGALGQDRFARTGPQPGPRLVDALP